MMLAGTLHRHEFDSSVLHGNLLGDPSKRELFVYTPPDYARCEAIPLVMVLPGYGGTHNSLLNVDPYEPNIVQRFERLVRAGKCQNAALVFPDTHNRYFGSQFIDSSVGGPYQSYLADEVVPFVEDRYRTLATASGRAIVGRSSGGFGALRMGIERPEVFSVIGSHAGDSAFDLSIRPALVEAAIAYDQAGGPGAFVEHFSERPQSHSFTAMMLVAYGAAYAPAPDAPAPHVAFPFDTASGVLRSEVWARYLANDPVELLKADTSALADARFVFLDAGDRDEHGLQFGARQLYALLRARDARVHFEEFPGTHRGTAFRYDRSLPLLVDACYGR